MRAQHWIYILPLRVRTLLRRGRVDQELEEELRYHIERKTRENIAKGMAAAEARRAALVEMGGMERRKEECRDTRRLTPVQDFSQDLRYGARMLRKNPGFAVAAVLTLALGIGANTAIFSVINAVLLRPLPFPEPDRLVAVEYFDTALKVPHETASYPDFFDWRRQSQIFEHITSFHESNYTLTGTERPEHLNGEVVSADFFATLGVAPQLGRGFVREEETKGHHAAVLSDPLWRSLFGGDRTIIGRGITLNNVIYTIVGVAPAGFNFPITTPAVQLWTTAADDAEMTGERGAHFVLVLGRLKPGIPLAQAQAEMDRVDANLAKQYPESNLHFAAARVEPELQHLVGDVEPALFVLFGAVGCVLLIACANVANLLLARSMARQREMAIRGAMGASRTRVVCQLLTESALLGLLGGGLGLTVALWGTRVLVGLIPEDVPRMSSIRADAHVFVFTLAVAVLTGILFGLAPALQSARTDIAGALKESGRALSGGLQHSRLRGSLVAAEMALSVALLMGAGLLIQSFAHLQDTNPGFNSHNLLTLTFALPDTKYTIAQQKIFYRQALDRLNEIPGVVSACGALPLPLSGANFDVSFTIEGRPVQKGNEPDEEIQIVGPGYFHTMGIPVLEGREFAVTDTPTSPNVVMVNRAFVKKYFPNEDAIGKRINPGLADSDVSETPLREIVGVTGDVKTRALSGEAKPEYFFPYQQALISNLRIVLRTKAAPESALGAARDAIQSMDPGLAVFSVKTMDQYVGASVAQPRFSALLLTIFAAIALALTGLGLYGVVSYSVAQRTHEVGIRIALGAGTGDVLTMIIRKAMLLAGIGWAAGIAAGFGLTRFLSGQLFGVRASDPATVAAVTIVLGAIAAVASYIPARRATRVDPIVALRHE